MLVHACLLQLPPQLDGVGKVKKHEVTQGLMQQVDDGVIEAGPVLSSPGCRGSCVQYSPSSSSGERLRAEACGLHGLRLPSFLP